MDRMELLTALRRLSVETGSLACMGCGHENNCGIKGCAVIRAAVEYIKGDAIATVPESDTTMAVSAIWPKVYIISPYAGNVRRNVAEAKRWCRFAVSEHRIPVASHLLYPQILDDNDPEQRRLGLAFGLALLGCCDEAWVFGSVPSEGMRAEIAEAERLDIPVRWFGDCHGEES